MSCPPPDSNSDAISTGINGAPPLPHGADCCVLALTASPPTTEIVFLNGSFVLGLRIKRTVVSFPQSVTKSFTKISQTLLAKPSNETVPLINYFNVNPVIRC